MIQVGQWLAWRGSECALPPDQTAPEREGDWSSRAVSVASQQLDNRGKLFDEDGVDGDIGGAERVPAPL